MLENEWSVIFPIEKLFHIFFAIVYQKDSSSLSIYLPSKAYIKYVDKMANNFTSFTQIVHGNATSNESRLLKLIEYNILLCFH